MNEAGENRAREKTVWTGKRKETDKLTETEQDTGNMS